MVDGRRIHRVSGLGSEGVKVIIKAIPSIVAAGVARGGMVGDRDLRRSG
jgi:hypothetical protein